MANPLKPLALAVTAALLVSGTATAATTLRFSHTDNPGGSRQAAAELFGEKLAEYTDDRYELRIYPAGQLANDPKAIEQLQLGGLDFTVSATGSYATHLPSLNLTAMPFLVDTIQSLRFHEVAPNITLTRHVYSPLPLAISEATWQTFSDEDQETTTRAAADAATFSRELVQSSIDSQLEQMGEAGAVVSVPEIGPFRDAVASVHDKARGVYGDEPVERILDDAAAIREAMPAE